ncbi:major facilitator superfamily MFS_1 [Sphaerospermopsis reniformis]|uniref:Major facilitator superfamily MFS_1 n=1 Tax=Sphaerospermopsis reniformis TaxID=531300 RepID=A0A480A590_9CYAN|nr:MFS transporter [Sphaerospermopsis reniformis]GCL39999.1 major facilitator superfamily MFS_1 [Sphaerospermopsis reniformis]
MKTFFAVWFCQFISLFGSQLTSFVLGIWVYQSTSSVTQFALISFFTMLPGLVISPLAGALVDRWDRRWAMIISDSVAGLSTFGIVLLLITGQLEIWHIYFATTISSISNAFQWPAYGAAITLLVPKQYLSRANGMIQLSEAVAQLLSPICGGFLVILIQLQGVIFLDLATFLFALVTLLIVKFPKPETTSAFKHGKGSLLQESIYGWNYIRVRPGLMALLIFFTISNFAVSTSEVLFTPLVLSFTSEKNLGMVLSIGGSGMLIGSLVMSIWGGLKRLIYGVLGFEFLLGVGIFLVGMRTSIILVTIGGFIAFFSIPMFQSASNAIWQTKVAPDVQGRVFAIRRMVAWSSRPLAYLTAGLLAERVFEPLMTVNGLLAGSIGKIIGTGTGRGIGLMFIVMGILTMLITIIAYQYAPLRLVEDELPDFS